MESWNSPVGEKESPSQDKIAHPQLLKRDGESLDDFEDITKDETSVKDTTTQFLQFETGDITNNHKKEFAFEDDPIDSEGKYNDPLHKFSNNKETPKSEEFDIASNLEPAAASLITVRDDLLSFEQTDTQSESNVVEEPAANPIVNILNENKLVDVTSTDEISTGSDDLSFIPKKGESSPALYSDISKKPPLECKSSETTDVSFISQPLSKFTSESGMTKEQEPEVLQGDGLHIRKTVEDVPENDDDDDDDDEEDDDDNDNDDDDDDDNDNDDVAPEPIPKDYPEIGVIESKFLTAFRLVESLIYWRDPKKSGIVFGGILIILLSLTSFSLISVVAYTSLTVLIAALTFRIYKSVMQAVQKTSEGHPFKEYLDIDLTVNPDKAREISDIVVKYINKTLAEFRRLFLIEDVIDSIKFAGLLWGLTFIGAWFNGLSLLIIAFVGLFTLPKVYENNKTQIDANLDLARTKVNEITEKIAAVIPQLGKKAEVKDKGE